MEHRPTDIDILHRYLELGIRDVFSVPCSITASWTRHALDAARRGQVRLEFTNHEGNLVGLATGLHLGTGRVGLLHLQNSGLPNLGDGLVSLASTAVYAVPMAMLVTWRGADADEDSEPHQEIGRRTATLVRALVGGTAEICGHRSGRGVLEELERSVRATQRGHVGVMQLAEKGFVRAQAAWDDGRSQPVPAAPRGERFDAGSVPGLRPARPLTRDEALSAIVDAHRDAAILFCNGFTARAARAVADRPGNFYNVGYMGGTLAIGWGLAKARPDLEVVVVDGDQNAMMSTMKDHLAADHPRNLRWYVLDNRIGASVGGPPSLPLGPSIRSLARVVETLPDAPGSFRHPRVGAAGARFEDEPPASIAGRLPSLAWRFREWASRQAARPSRAWRNLA